MRKDVYLFRHGQTDANKEHRWQGCGINLSLNEEGRVQAFSVLEKLRNAGLECIFFFAVEAGFGDSRNCRRSFKSAG